MNEIEFRNTIALADSGDFYAINFLITHYYLNKTPKLSIDEVLKWSTLGAEKGNVGCMLQTSCLLVESVSGKGLDYIRDFEKLVSAYTAALKWDQRAVELGADYDEERIACINCELGLIYYFNVNDSIRNLEKAINYIKPYYKKVNDKDYWIALGLALCDYSMEYNITTGDDINLAFSLLTECVNKHFNDLRYSAAAAKYLGIMYTEGVGCQRDYDTAVYYFQMAHNAGHDCSYFLNSFKKTLFGGYKLI